MSALSEIHLLRARLEELENNVQVIDRGVKRSEEKLRDKIAMAALTGIVAAAYNRPFAPSILAREAYMLADAMLEARSQS